jgi:uncharacterized protein YggE
VKRPFIVALAVTASALGPSRTDAQESPVVDSDAGFIQVSGNGSLDVPVDRAHVVFAVETEASEARDAVGENAAAMDGVLAALRALDVPGLDVETMGFNLQPQYERGAGEVPRIRAYRAVNNVSVTVDDVEAVGTVIDAATGAGANRVASLRFDARDTQAARLEALRLATDEARSQAEVLAAALGYPLGPPLEVHGNAQSPMPPPMPMLRGAIAYETQSAGPATPVEAGDQTVTASVTIKYRLGGGPSGGADGESGGN